MLHKGLCWLGGFILEKMTRGTFPSCKMKRYQNSCQNYKRCKVKKQGTGQAANSMLPFVREDINTGCLHTHKLRKYIEREWG